MTLGSAIAAGLAVPAREGARRLALVARLLGAARRARRGPVAAARPRARDSRRGACGAAAADGFRSPGRRASSSRSSRWSSTAALTWLPTILRADGYSAGTAGTLQAVANSISFVPAFVLPFLACRMRTQTPMLAGVVLPAIVGALGLLLLPAADPLWMVVLGLSAGRRARARPDPARAARRRRAHGRRPDRDDAVGGLSRRGGRPIAARARTATSAAAGRYRSCCSSRFRRWNSRSGWPRRATRNAVRTP